MDAGLQAQQADAVGERMCLEPLQQLLCKTLPAIRRPNVHPLQLAIFRTVKLDSAAAGRLAVHASHEERDALADQLIDAVSVPALLRVERAQMRLQLLDER